MMIFIKDWETGYVEYLPKLVKKLIEKITELIIKKIN